MRIHVGPWVRVAPAVFVLAWGGNHFTPLLHLYEESAGYSVWQANLMLGMYVVGLIPGLLVAAAISDTYGRKPVMFVGLLAGAVGSILLFAGVGSFAFLCVGRVLAGAGVGVAMSVGSTWMSELSSARYEHTVPIGVRARRPALTLTLGFGVGALVTGSLAQWGPLPTQLPFVVHVVLAMFAAAVLTSAPESFAPGAGSRRQWWKDLRVPAVKNHRFLRLLVPAAPWIFAAAGVAYAIMPAVSVGRLGEWTTLFATLLTGLTLGSGALVQPVVVRIDRRMRGYALPLGLVLMTIGMAASAGAAAVGEPALSLLVAVVLGLAYGITLVAGLTHVQAIASPHELAGLTGVYYSLAYLGFLLPALLAGLLPFVPYPISLCAITLLCAACTWVVFVGARRYVT